MRMKPSYVGGSFSVLFLFAASLFGCAGASNGVRMAGDATLSFSEETRISNIRQLTFGGTNAEAYWSYDGRYLTFQHSGEDAKCDQIFKMGADGRNRIRISNGLGRTTCSFFTPDDDHIIFSSTQSGGRECPAEPDKSKGYVWALYPSYQFYRATSESKDMIPIEPGAPSAYNAEMVTCKNGAVIFTSDRGGDLDLYTGRLDGSGMVVGVKQITKTLGYDGGAFFSPDCKRIVWRASRPRPGRETNEYLDLLAKHLIKPTELEIWTANADGSDAKQITKLGAATFAPYFTPDGNHVIFSSNYGSPGGRQFSIFMVRTNGTELEKVTYSNSFDSFPMFSPDGKYLAFSSSRNARKAHESNVFVADWNPRAPGPIITDDDANPVNRWYVVDRELSSPDMEGRGIGTEGLQRAETYAADLFQKAGIREMNPPGGGVMGFGEEIKGYEHEIEIVRGVELSASGTSLKADWRPMKVKEEYAPASFSGQGSLAGKIMDVGYGIVAPELGVDDYEGKNIKGKVALVRRGVAKGLNLSVAQEATYGDLRYKAFLARERGATAVAFWEPETSDDQKSENLMASLESSNSTVSADAGIPVIFVSRKIARDWIGAPKPVALAGKIALENKKISASNIVGIMGSDAACRAGHPVVIGAHLDHLGYGGENSLEGTSARVIHPGADDNASGVASILEAARTVGKALKEGKATGCYLFAAFTAEESGVIGSSRFVDLLRKKKIHPKAMLNLDMVGRMTGNRLAVFGADTASEWKKIVKRNCDANVLTCEAGGDGYGPSDHMPFYLARVPVLHFFTGAHADYHRSSDTSDKINPVGGVQIGQLVGQIAIEVANRDTVLNYVKKSGASTMAAIQSRSHGDGKGFGAYLGTIPNYTRMNGAAEGEEVKGVILSGARDGSPAAEGGVKEDDVVVGITVLDEAPGFAAARPKKSEIQSLQDYTFVLKSLKPGMRIKMHVWRKGKIVDLPITVGRKAKS
ncbi:MAG: M28 family peptidase [Bdellovibrionales bacterium]|nr:M28 family peptidase [Bdellovibrionales bacterium]